MCRDRHWPCRAPAVDLDEAVRAAHGKFVVGWDRIADAPDDALAILAATLEAAPAAAAAGLGDDPVLWRRWALVDPGSGHEGTEPAALDMPLREPSRLKPGCCPLEEWTVDGAPIESSRGASRA